MFFMDLMGCKLSAFFKSICATFLLIITACSTPPTIDMTLESPEDYAEVYIYTQGKYTFNPRVYISGLKTVVFLYQGFTRVYVKSGEASLSVRWQNYGSGGAPDVDGLLTFEASKKYYILLRTTMDVQYYKRKINYASEAILVDEQQALKDISDFTYIEPISAYLESKVVMVD